MGPIPSQTVVIEGSEITQVVDAGSNQIPRAAQSIDGQNKYLVTNAADALDTSSLGRYALALRE